jgi:hypothetical protein
MAGGSRLDRAALNQPDNENDERDDEQEVNQTSTDVQRETAAPKDQQQKNHHEETHRSILRPCYLLNPSEWT